ncbi:MAG: sigma-54-dependent Fis family transcriptional regulator, partial [Desulfobacterium sp.]|nr:sigma-54-dependent Fis family transcriptional regulator [Desulfobacterium sp.]
LLINYFLKKFQKKETDIITGFNPEAMDAMLAYNWPGNVRELENVIKRIIVLCDKHVVEFDDLPEHIQQIEITFPKGDTAPALDGVVSFDIAVQDYERRLIMEALEKSDGIKAKAAKLLNIKRTTLVEKMKKQNFSKSACA